jgi:organic hydroperoxide reductase OsmC/OhrA
MSEHIITLDWHLQTESFDYDLYNRTHTIIFEGTNRICASAAPEFHGDASCVNPEQSFVASLASCHMLTFLALASKKQYMVTRYRDNAMCVLGKNSINKTAITHIQLKPEVTFSAKHVPSTELFDQLQERAHKGCFIANSIASCIAVTIAGQLIVD